MMVATMKINKAIVPIAGLGSRMGPLGRVVPKVLLPLPHPAGLAVPLVHWVCAEAAAAGVEQVLRGFSHTRGAGGALLCRRRGDPPVGAAAARAPAGAAIAGGLRAGGAPGRRADRG